MLQISIPSPSLICQETLDSGQGRCFERSYWLPFVSIVGIAVPKSWYDPSLLVPPIPHIFLCRDRISWSPSILSRSWDFHLAAPGRGTPSNDTNPCGHQHRRSKSQINILPVAPLISFDRPRAPFFLDEHIGAFAPSYIPKAAKEATLSNSILWPYELELAFGRHFCTGFEYQSLNLKEVRMIAYKNSIIQNSETPYMVGEFNCHN